MMLACYRWLGAEAAAELAAKISRQQRCRRATRAVYAIADGHFTAHFGREA